jgi:hypothetical protein
MHFHAEHGNENPKLRIAGTNKLSVTYRKGMVQGRQRAFYGLPCGTTQAVDRFCKSVFMILPDKLNFVHDRGATGNDLENRSTA